MPATDGLMPPGMSTAQKQVLKEFGGWTAFMQAYGYNTAEEHDIAMGFKLSRSLAHVATSTAKGTTKNASAKPTPGRIARLTVCRTQPALSSLEQKFVNQSGGWTNFMRTRGLEPANSVDCADATGLARALAGTPSLLSAGEQKVVERYGGWLSFMLVHSLHFEDADDVRMARETVACYAECDADLALEGRSPPSFTKEKLELLQLQGYDTMQPCARLP